jgi:cytochrome P450
VFGATRRSDYEEVARAAGEEFTGVIGDLIERYRKAPEDNLLSLLLADENHPAGLTTTEIVGACSLLLFAGHDTTASLLGAATAALLGHRDQIPYLSGGAGPVVACAVEELLRYEPPAKAMTRIVVEDHERGGHQLLAGQNVYLVILAANRDPRAFADPDRLDLTRTPNPHLSFGFGHHFCLGVSLVR